MLNFIMWAAQTFPDFEIRVREHPGEPLRDEDVARALMMTNVTLMPPNEFSLSDVLSDCRVAVAINSTTLLEAAASGVVPLILDVSGFGPYHPDIAGDGAAVEVTNFVDARTELARLVSDDRHCASFAGSLEKVRRGLFRQHGDQALNAITAEIKELGGLGASRSGDKMESGASA